VKKGGKRNHGIYRIVFLFIPIPLAGKKRQISMNLHLKRTEEVFALLANRDTLLGFRELLDCAMDAQSMSIYQQAIELTQWKEENPLEIEELIRRSQTLLSIIQQEQVAEQSREHAVLTAHEICKSYGSSKFSLGPVSVEIKKGQVYGLVGENGNGKTTLLRILAKEISHQQGSLTYRFSTPTTDDYDLRTRLIYIPQRTERWYGSL